MHGRPASEYRTRKPTAAISDFTTNRTAAAQQSELQPAAVQLKEAAPMGRSTCSLAVCRADQTLLHLVMLHCQNPSLQEAMLFRSI